MLDAEKLCNHVARLTHARVRAYNGQHQLIYQVSNGDNHNSIFDYDRDFELKLLQMGSIDKPVLYTEHGDIIYAVIKGKNVIYLVGPCCCQKDTREASKYLAMEHGSDNSRIFRVSASTIDNVYECALLLFHSVSDKPMSKEQMLLDNHDLENFTHKVEEKMMGVYNDYRENSMVHNPYSQERREQESIKNGDLEGLKAALDEVYVGELGRMAKEELRSVKNLAIAVLTLASRSAIEGGLMPEIAYSMSDAYSQRFEELNSAAEVEALLRNAEYQYASLVKEIKDKKHTNPIITGCKDYVNKHLSQKITLSQLAQMLNVNASYLSDLFSRQEGITLSEYILREKVEASKRQLIFTDESYGTIAYNYAFSSQSHYGKTFKKFTGLTPKEYRKINKVSELR